MICRGGPVTAVVRLVNRFDEGHVVPEIPRPRLPNPLRASRRYENVGCRRIRLRKKDGRRLTNNRLLEITVPLFTPMQSLGPYKLIKVLGQGTFAEVWLGEKATDVVTRFALKIPSQVDKNGRPNGVDIRKIKDEAKYWASASHPGHINVVPVIEASDLPLVDSSGHVVQTPAGPFFTIVTEYCAEGSLHEWLSQYGGKAPSIKAAVSIANGIGEGLKHLHDRGLIHRDIKPANIMMLGETPRIADFGLVRGSDDTITTGADGLPIAAGSPAYMSPEALKGERHADVDVWALGILLYELLQGSRPREITASGPIPPLGRGVPDNIHELLLKVLHDDRMHRIRSAADFVRRLKLRKQLLVAAPTVITLAKARQLLRDSDSALVAIAQKVLDEFVNVLRIREWDGNREDAAQVLEDVRVLFQEPVLVPASAVEDMLAKAERALLTGAPKKMETSFCDLTGYDWVTKVIKPVLDAVPSVEQYEDKLFEFPVNIHGALLFVRMHREFGASPRAKATWGLIRALANSDVGEWVLPLLATTLETRGPGCWEHREVIKIARLLLADRFPDWYRTIRGRSVTEDIEAEEKKDEAKWRHPPDRGLPD